MTTPARNGDRGSAAGAIGIVVDLAVPLVMYYGLRLLGVGIYRALIAPRWPRGLRHDDDRARSTWTIGALAVLALSLAGPAAGVGTASKIALAGMHLLVAIVLIRGMRRSSGRQ